MKLYLISQTENREYDTYDSAVVAAPDAETARYTDPSQWRDGKPVQWGKDYSDWCSKPELVTVQLIGTAVRGTKQGVICSSFNAG